MMIIKEISQLEREETMQVAALVVSNNAYRQHFYATAELTTCMNSLARARIPLLRVAVDEKNDLVIRLLSKLGFTEETRATLMTRGRLS